MFSRLSDGLFSILILLIFKLANIHGFDCSPGEMTCSRDSSTWCCQKLIHLCGSEIGVCKINTMPPIPPSFLTRPPYIFTPPSVFTQRPNPTSPSSNFGPGLVVVIVMIPIIFLFTCLTVCIRLSQKQRSQNSIVTTNNRRVVGQCQQQLIRVSVPIVHVGQSYNDGSVSLPLSNMHEVPPSYEAATANLSSKYQADPPPYSPNTTVMADLPV